ncbi:ATP-binding cassette domain-containing protein [bacterium]|nr:ATP-binding cassette domain-containing protein [bacterium]
MIETQRLSKRYGREPAVDEVTFSIRRGEIVGFLGPNGAGKTTTMRMLTGYLPPTSGTAAVAGHDVVSESLEVRRRVGYLPETTPLYPELTVREYLEFIGGLRGLAGARLAAGIERSVESCGLRKVFGKGIGELSKGYRQRVGIGQAILHDPDLLILDEPTSGLDPSQVVEVRDLVSSLGKEKTVILSTHVLSEVQAVCSRVLIISAGRIVADGGITELRATHAQASELTLLVKAADDADLRARLGALPGVRSVHAEPAGVGFIRARVAAAEDLREPVFRLAVSSGWTLLELSQPASSLEEIFLKLTGGGKSI